jgi:hypothetical protein
MIIIIHKLYISIALLSKKDRAFIFLVQDGKNKKKRKGKEKTIKETRSH